VAAGRGRRRLCGGRAAGKSCPAHAL